MPINIAPAPVFPTIDRAALAQKIERIEFQTCPALMAHGVANKEITEPASMVVSTLYGIVARLKAGLEAGVSDQDMLVDVTNLPLYEDAAAHWTARTTRWDHAV